MNFKATIIQLYFLLIYTDGKVNQGEIALGKKMIKAEGINEGEFVHQLEALKSRDAGLVYKESLENLRRMKKTDQIRCIAWMCVLANSDGFMDKAEWQFIYKLYHKELKLPLDEVMEKQKELTYSTRDGIHVAPSATNLTAPSSVA